MIDAPLTRDIAAAFNPRSLNLILFPTEKCNFRCTYCYEDFKSGRMNPAVVDGIKNLLTYRFPSLDFLEISWFGGEPLLACDIVEDISRFIISNQSKKLTYSANMTTNGFFLSARRASQLTQIGINTYQISLDGPRHIHNRSRYAPAGTFDTIWGNLCDIRRDKAINAQVILRVHYSPENVDSLADLVDMLNLEFSEDARFRVYFKAIEHLGGPNDQKQRIFSNAEKARVKAQLEKLLKYPSQIYKLSSSAGGRYICYAAKANSFAIRADGSVGKCTVALYDARNSVGRLNEDGSISFDRNKLLPWLQGFETLNPNTLACPYMALEPRLRA